MSCDNTNTNPCKTCNQGITIPTCTELCDFIVETDCVKLSEDIECLGAEGDDLTTALNNFCNNSTDDDWTKDVNGVWNNTDNIGIGTNTPNFNLDVVGDSNQLFNNTNYITNANVNIPSLFGNPPVSGDVSMLRYSDANQNNLVWVGSQFAQIAVDTPSYVSGLTVSPLTGTFIKTDDGANSTGLTILPSELKIDGTSGVTGSFATIDGKSITVTKGITTAITSVGTGFGLINVLNASDTTNQTPSGLDSALQVTFGSAQGTVADPVMVDALGNITFNESGIYLINGYASFERQGSSSGSAVIAFRALINGVQAGATKVVELRQTATIIPYDLTIPINATAGDVLTWEIMRDSSGVNEGGLYSHILSGGWSNVPSATLSIYKLEI